MAIQLTARKIQECINSLPEITHYKQQWRCIILSPPEIITSTTTEPKPGLRENNELIFTVNENMQWELSL